MKKERIQRSNVRFERTEHEKTLYGFRPLAKAAMWSFAVQALFLLSAVLMGLRVFTIKGITLRHILFMGILLAFLVLIFELILPYVTRNLKKHYRTMIRWLAAAEIVYLSGKIFYAFYLRHRLDLEDGMLKLAIEYVKIYNSYYKKSIRVPIGKEEYVAFAFAFVLMIAIIVQYLLVQLLRVRAFVLLLPCTVLMAELWVGLVPDAKSLFVFSASCVFLAVGQGSSWKVKGASVLLWGLLFGLCVFALKGAAKNLILQAPKYKAYQRQLEAQITGIQFSGLWGSREYVSNKEPKYSDKEILTITADARINGNLYLKAFTGTTYNNGNWKADDSSFSSACMEGGIDENQMENLLWNEAARELSDHVPDAQDANYTITYKNSMQTNALVPYFSDLTDCAQLKADNDQNIEKKRMAQTMQVSGINANDAVNSAMTLLISYSSDKDTGSDDMWGWYSEFASDTYLDTNENVASAGTCADWIADNSVYAYSAVDPNLFRLFTAAKVSDYLCGNYHYSWNLDDITDGTDPVEYFLASGGKGYCMHFASAGTLILRELGIPARYAAGYVVKSNAFHSNGDGTYTASVRDRNAHAWTEIYLDNIGWVPVEMTAGYARTNSALPTDKAVAEEREQREKDSQAKEQTESEEEHTGESETTETETETESETESQTDTQTKPEDETEENSGNTHLTAGKGDGLAGAHGWLSLKNKTVRTVAKIGALLIGMAAFAGCAIALVRRQIRTYHELLNRDLRRKRYKKAVKRMNRRIYKRLKRTQRTARTHLKDREYESLLMECYKEIETKDWQKYMNIVKKAAFSAGAPEQEEAMFCYEIYKKIVLDRSRRES